VLSINDRPVDRAGGVRSDPAMPKYDAFGREIGEDSLESLGWSSGGTVTPSPEPAEEAPPAPPPPEPSYDAPPPPTATFGTPPPPSPPPPNAPTAGDPLAGGDPFAAPPPPPPARYRKRRGGRRGMSRLVAFAVFVVIGANVIPGFLNGVKDATDGLNIDVPDIPEIDAPAVPETKTAKPPVGLGDGSMIRRAAFAKSLADLQEHNLGKLTHLRLAPERIDVQTLKNGRLTASQLSVADGFRKFSTSGPGFGNSSTLPWGRLDPGAPQRLVRAAAERIHKPVSKIDYLVASEYDGKIVWGAYFKGGQIVQGDPRGRVTRRIS
jgi:hypothetical protein